VPLQSAWHAQGFDHHWGIDADRRYERYQEDAGVLAEIGRVLFSQPRRLTVRRPKPLADRALAAWGESDEGDLGPETPAQVKTRHRAAALSLIGLSVENRGLVDGDEVVVELDAWFVGNALDAADEAGMLVGLSPPPQDS
jgi:hypothetical protein